MKIVVPWFLLLSLLFPGKQLNAQNDPFQIKIESFSIQDLPGIQSFAFGSYQGKWIIFGGRLDGLHRRQPFASFDIPGHNTRIWVVDPISRQKWSTPLNSLSQALQDQLSSTNMEFLQEGNYLYVVGGYGYSNITASRVTYDRLTAIDVPGLMGNIISGGSISPYFRQVSHPDFAVTGGHLKKIYNTWYLVGGQKFTGNYNPMGNPTYTQEYTNAIRKFKLDDDGIALNISHLPSIIDANHLHRRDYNVTPQILPDGKEGLTAFSGVFQPNFDLPFLNSVTIDSSGYGVNQGFSQYFNHYHCANVPIYSASAQEMHTVFFGGISQYYESQGTLIQDNNVPFVKTIARVTRTTDGHMSEYKLPIEMPGYLGSGSEFLLNPEVSVFKNGVLQWDSIPGDTTLVGYIFGGISSSAANIFFTNTGEESIASGQILKVWMIRNVPAKVHQLNEQSRGGLQMQVFPNPTGNKFQINFSLKKPELVVITVADPNGKTLKKSELKNCTKGENHFEDAFDGNKSGFYTITIQTPTEKSVQKIVFKP